MSPGMLNSLHPILYPPTSNPISAHVSDPFFFTYSGHTIISILTNEVKKYCKVDIANKKKVSLLNKMHHLYDIHATHF